MTFFYQTSGFSPNATLVSAVAQILNGTWINKPILDPKCTVLVVGTNVPKTEKLLMSLGAAIPILDRKYLYDCVNARKVLDQDSYDIGGKTLQAGRKLVPQTLAQRQMYRQGSRAGQCHGWHVILALENAQNRETYQRILESAGAVVFKDWSRDSLQPLLLGDAVRSLTHVFSEPDLFWNPGPWKEFLTEACDKKGLDSKPLFVGSYFYISEFLFSDYVPDLRHYMIDSPKMKVIHAKYTLFKDQEESGKSDKIKSLGKCSEAPSPLQRNVSLSMAPNMSFSSAPSKRKHSFPNPQVNTIHEVK